MFADVESTVGKQRNESLRTVEDVAEKGIRRSMVFFSLKVFSIEDDATVLVNIAFKSRKRIDDEFRYIAYIIPISKLF